MYYHFIVELLSRAPSYPIYLSCCNGSKAQNAIPNSYYMYYNLKPITTLSFFQNGLPPLYYYSRKVGLFNSPDFAL